MLKKNEDFKEELETQYTILIKAEEREQKRRALIMYIICGLTLFMTTISLITVSISLGRTKKEQVEKEEQKIVYQTLTTNYNGSKVLDLQGIGNGYYLQSPKIITISNEGTDSLTYNIKLTSIATSLTSTNNLTYTLTKDDETSSTKELPLKEEYILKEIKLEPGETRIHKINVAFTGTLEYGNYSNYYKANIVVEQNNKQMNLLN